MTESFYAKSDNARYNLDTNRKSKNQLKTNSPEKSYFSQEPNLDHSRTLAHEMVKRFGEKEAFNRCKKNHWNHILNIFSESLPLT